MRVLMREIFMKIRSMEKGNMSGKTEEFMKGIGTITKCTGRVFLCGLMVENTTDSTIMTKKRDSGFSCLRMDGDTRGSGKTASNMVEGTTRRRT